MCKSNTTFEEIGQIIEGGETFLVISHVSPDGDAIGSVLALGSILEVLGKTVYYRNEDGVPNSLKFLPNSGAIELPGEDALNVDVVFALDCATRDRLGSKVLHQSSGAKVVVNIDHHKTNTGYGDFQLIDIQSPATGQIIYNLCVNLGYPLTDIARDNLYVAVSTDTGSFRYRGTTEKTYQMIADLVEKGVDVARINEETYERCPLRKVKLLGELLKTLNVSADGKVADWLLRQKVKDHLKILPDDTEDMINHIRAIEGVMVACSFEDLPNGKVRISLRSKSDRLDMSSVAQCFGGGGHARAAGIRLDGPIENARERVLAAVNQLVAKSF